MNGQRRWKGHNVFVNLYGNLPNTYKVEFVSGFQQPYVDGAPRRVPQFPRVIVEMSEEGVKFQWEAKPSITQFTLKEFEEEAKTAIEDFHSGASLH